MKPRCDELRERGWRDGLRSRSYHVWRIHARSCPDCRTDFYLLETLQRQAANEKRHLGQTELRNLVHAAHQQWQQAEVTRSGAFWGWSLRALASSAIVALLVAAVYRHGTGPQPGVARQPQHGTNRHAVASPALPAASQRPGSMEAASAHKAPHDILIWPAPPPGGPIEDRLYRLRRRIEHQCDALLELLDDDVDQGDRQDVWDVSLISVAALA